MHELTYTFLYFCAISNDPNCGVFLMNQETAHKMIQQEIAHKNNK